MNTWILDPAIARLLSTNVLVLLTEPPDPQMVDQPELSRNGLRVTEAVFRITGIRTATRLPEGSRWIITARGVQNP